MFLKPKRAFPSAQSDKSGPGSQTQLAPEGWGPLNKGFERRTRALPDVSGGGERHDRFGMVVGEGVVEPRIEGRFAWRVGAGMHALPLLPEPEMAQDALDNIFLVDERNDAHFP